VKLKRRLGREIFTLGAKSGDNKVVINRPQLTHMKIGGRCVEDSNPSGLNPVAQMVEHTSTTIYSN